MEHSKEKVVIEHTKTNITMISIFCFIRETFVVSEEELQQLFLYDNTY